MEKEGWGGEMGEGEMGALTEVWGYEIKRTLSVLGIFLTNVRSHSPMYTTEGAQALATFQRS